MSWQYNRIKKWYKFSNKVQEIIDEKFKDEYGYVEFIDDINFPGDILTIVFDFDNNNHKLQIVDEEYNVRKKS